MKLLYTTILTFTTLAAGSSVCAQGLLSLRQRDEFERRLPFTFSVYAGAGYDTNINLSSTDEADSMYANFGVTLDYAGGDRRTSYSVGAHYGGNYYFDAPETMDDYFHNIRLSLNVRHRVNPRLTIMDSFYVSYEFEPNYQIGASTTRRTEQYFYGYNDLSVAYAWTERLSTVTGYTVSGIQYEEDALAGDSYISHIFHHEFRWALSKLTTAVLEYRYAFAEYDNNFGDYTSNYFLVGVDHNFSRQLYGTARVGAEIRERDNGGSGTSPYFEGALYYRQAKDTTFNLYGRVGYEDSVIGAYQDRYSYRVGLSMTHKITDRLTGSAGVHYIHDQFEDGDSVELDDGSTFTAPSYDEDVFSLSLGLEYVLWRNVSLAAGYSYYTSSSGQEDRDYNRHNFSLGIRATF